MSDAIIIKPVPNLPFFATSNGQILNKYGKPYKTAYTKQGYERFSTTVCGVDKAFNVHRLVAMAFIDNPKGLPCVNHIDEDPSNNRPENLEWCTHKYNSNYGTCIERKIKAQMNRPDCSKPVIGTKDGTEVYFPSAKQAQRELKINNAAINACCQGKRNTAGGYTWRFAL